MWREIEPSLSCTVKCCIPVFERVQSQQFEMSKNKKKKIKKIRNVKFSSERTHLHTEYATRSTCEGFQAPLTCDKSYVIVCESMSKQPALPSNRRCTKAASTQQHPPS